MDALLKLFNIELLILFAAYLLKYLYPTLWVLLPFLIRPAVMKSQKDYFRCFLLILFTDLFLRVFIFMAGLPYQGRYFYPFVVALIVLAGAGFNPLKKYIYNLLMRFFSSFSHSAYKKHIKHGLITLLIIASLPKALRPQHGKEWIQLTATEIRKRTPGGKKPVLISSLDDIRIAYYSKSSFFKFVNVNDFIKGSKISINGKEFVSLNACEGPDISNNKISASEISLSGKAQLIIKLSAPYPARKAYLYLDWQTIPQGYMQIYSVKKQIRRKSILRRKNNNTIQLYSGKIVSKIPIYHCKFTDSIKIELTLTDKAILKGISLYRFEKWKILRQGRNYNYGKWFFLPLPGEIENIASNIREMGGDRVFLILKGNKEQIKNMFVKHKLNLPVRLILTFKVRKKGFFTLCQGILSNPAQPQPN